jgi:divinyl chlorophyllide a 8-vinyl-reductase
MLSSGNQSKRIMLLGASGTIGRATLAALQARGYTTVCLFRPGAKIGPALPGAEFRNVDLTDTISVMQDGFRGEYFDGLISCLASRSGAPDDAWAIDYRAHANILSAAQASGIGHFVLLSAICVQRPRLAFQHTKLAFEQLLSESGVAYSIVRPTAFFKSLSGQVERVRQGKPFLLFGNGELTACKPISDADLANYLVDCLENPLLQNRILPIGGPGEAITPRQQGELLFAAFGKQPRFRRVPLWLFDAIGAALGLAGLVSKRAAQKAELARIGRYYATESMLLLDPVTGRYDAVATPATGTETLAGHYARLARGEIGTELGDHSVF